MGNTGSRVVVAVTLGLRLEAVVKLAGPQEGAGNPLISSRLPPSGGRFSSYAARPRNREHQGKEGQD